MRLATRGVSWISSTTRPSCQLIRGPRKLTATATEFVGISVSPVPLFEPWVPVHVVSVRLPESRVLLFLEGESSDPFRALPEIKVGNQAPDGPAVLGMQRQPVVLEHHP